MKHQFKIFAVVFFLITIFAVLASAQDSTEEIKPTPDPTIKVLGDVDAARAKVRETAVKFHLRLKINKEKSKLPWRQDKDKIQKYESILASPEIIEYMVDRSAEGMAEVESKLFSARGPPSAKEIGDGVLLEKILKWIEDGGLEEVLKFILALIEAFA